MLTFLQSSVFSRLGGKSTIKRAATSTVVLSDDDLDEDYEDNSQELEYAGVLKASPSKKAKVETSKKVTRKNLKGMNSVFGTCYCQRQADTVLEI